MSKPSPDKQRSEFAEIISQGKKYLFDEQMERARAEFSQAQSFAEAHILELTVRRSTWRMMN